MDKKPKNLKDFVEREFTEFIEGEYDEQGFFVTPNGSFWDPDGVYFNREGFDKHGDTMMITMNINRVKDGMRQIIVMWMK